MSMSEFRQFICRACGLIYDEALGDPDSGLAPGTRFEDIPEDWACPLCSVTKADFEPMVVAAAVGAKRVAVVSAGGSSTVSPAMLHSAGSASARFAPRREAPGVVIVGAGTAGWTLIEQLRARSADLPITLVSACSADRYDKPRLSVALHQGMQTTQLPRESGAQAAERLGVRLFAKTHASGISMASRSIRTSQGTLRFDELVLAHGAQARSCDGLPDALTWRINDLASYQGLRAALEALPEDRATPEQTDVILVGAGLVGCELANDLALAGYSVRLLEHSDRPLPMAQPEQSQALLQAWKALPLQFEGGVKVHQALRPSKDFLQVNCMDGRVFAGCILVSAVGLGTPSRLALQAGLRYDQGIVVDAQSLDTGVSRVHALGDCISIGGRPQRFIEPIHRQARLIADRICGLPVAPYDARPPAVRVKTSSLPLTLAA